VNGAPSTQALGVLAQVACLLEASTPKPGNVSLGRDFDDTRFEDFLWSAAAIGGAFGRAGEAGVGETVLAAVRETRRFVSVNTNLGIILLLAPLARAASLGGGPLRERLSRVLATLSADDARDVYAGIRLARPGGLGQVESQDVREEPTLTLRETMSLAAGRDTIAREYVTDYDVTFGLALPALGRARAAGLGWPAATLETYLHVLAQVPDTLIARKEGLPAAEAVSRRAKEVLAVGEPSSPERAGAVVAFDKELRGPGNRRNPGTTADLVAAALFARLSEDLEGARDGGV
jgi:triphosphoribosyl-dephospho-CoA synthase